MYLKHLKPVTNGNLKPMIKKISEIAEALILVIIGIGAFLAAAAEIVQAVITYSLQIDNLFTLFIYAEIIGSVSYTHLRAHETPEPSRMPSSA